jgi:MarR-like DNA-binding transcriptional regulator SgrR of sgrS sRNA
MRAPVVLVLAWMLASSPAFGESRPKYVGKVEGTLLGAPLTFDPVVARHHADMTVAHLLFDSLYMMSVAGTVQPHLAAAVPSFVAGAAKPTMRIQLRRGIKFHDGSVLTAADVVASLERARKTNRWVLAPVTAIRAVANEEIEVETTVSVSLETLLSLTPTLITKGGRDPGERPIGTGAFVLDSIDRAKGRLALKAFEDHFAGRAYLDRFVLHWYTAANTEAGQYETDAIQISSRGTTMYANTQPLFSALDVATPTALLLYVGFGGSAVTSDVDFRRALDQALVRSALKGITSGEKIELATHPVPLGVGGSVRADTDGGNLVAAKASLAAAAKRVPALAADKIGSLKLQIVIEDTRPDDKDIALRVAGALQQLGIASSIASVPVAQYATRVRDGTADLWIGQLVAPSANASLWWGTAFAAGNDDALVRMFASGRFDAGAAGKQFDARLPIVPLMFRNVKLWHRTDVRDLNHFDARSLIWFADLHLFGKPKATRP